MKKAIFLILTLTFSSSYSIAQKKLMLFTNGESYLTLKAESFLEELVDISGLETSDSLNKIVEVVNLNRLIKINGIQTDLKSAYHTFNPYGFLKLKKEDEYYLQNISSEINSCDLFLNINVNPFGNLIEYQLELFEYNKINVESKGEVKFLKLINNKLIAKTNFFIDPHKNNYLVQLKNGIRSLFRTTNFIPKPVIYVNNKPYSSHETVHWGLNDLLLIDASQSEDLDNDYNNLTFEWALLEYNGKKPNDLQTVEMQKNASIQSVRFPSTGRYKIGIKIWDGIAYSQEDSVTIDVVNNPVQYIQNTSYHFLKQGTAYDQMFYNWRVNALSLKNQKLVNYVSTSTSKNDLIYSPLQGNKSTNEFLEKRVNDAVRKGTRKYHTPLLSSSFDLTRIDTISEGVFKHNYTLNLADPGCYWVTASNNELGVQSKIDTVCFNYYYKFPFELDFLFDYIKMPVDTIPVGYYNACIGTKINILRTFSIDIQFPLLLNRNSLDIKKLSAVRYGVSTRFSNSLFKLFKGKASHINPYPVFDGYMGVYISEVHIDKHAKYFHDILLTSGLKYSPHKKIWFKNHMLEYNLGFTLNLSNVGNAVWLDDTFGFQFGISYAFLYLNN